MKLTVSDAARRRSSGSLTIATNEMKSHARFALCIKNRGHAASLEVRKVYRVRADETGAAHGLIRVVDESGDDYLYPAAFFVPIDVPPRAARVLAQRTR